MNNKNIKYNAGEFVDELLECLKSNENVWIKRFSLQKGMSYKKLLNLANKSNKLSEVIKMALLINKEIDKFDTDLKKNYELEEKEPQDTESNEQ